VQNILIPAKIKPGVIDLRTGPFQPAPIATVTLSGRPSYQVAQPALVMVDHVEIVVHGPHSAVVIAVGVCGGRRRHAHTDHKRQSGGGRSPPKIQVHHCRVSSDCYRPSRNGTIEYEQPRLL
jgi:hypothetical protein